MCCFAMDRSNKTWGEKNVVVVHDIDFAEKRAIFDCLKAPQFVMHVYSLKLKQLFLKVLSLRFLLSIHEGVCATGGEYTVT
jgi:hypothetical protein